MKKKTKKQSNKIILIIILLLVVILGTLIIIHLTKKSPKEEVSEETKEVIKEVNITFKDINEIELNEEITNEELIDKISNGKLTSEVEKINTSTLGKQTITFKVEDEKQNIKEFTKEITIVDKTPPVITYTENLKTEEGTKIDLLKNVKATDNSNEDIKVTVSGNYDFNKKGEYTIYYSAKDSSGNETKKEAKLVVNEKKKVEQPTPTPPTPTQPTQPTSTDGTFTTSKGFQGVTKNGITYIDGIMVVNKTYSLPSTYNPGGLTKETKDAFDKMVAAAKLDGINIHCQSGFRSYNTQNNLYNGYVKRDGAAAADKYSARPGHSEHQSGLACDICSNDSGKCINNYFDNTVEAKWLSANASKYGLILRFVNGKTNETGYNYESWHFRYVGVDLANKLYNNGNWITLEDYFGITSEYQ